MKGSSSKILSIITVSYYAHEKGKFPVVKLSNSNFREAEQLLLILLDMKGPFSCKETNYSQGE